MFSLKPTATITKFIPPQVAGLWITLSENQTVNNSGDSDKSPLTRQFKSNVLLGPIHKSSAEKPEFCIQLL